MVSAQLYVVLELIVVKLVCPCDVLLPTAESGFWQWCIAKNGGGYTQRGMAKGLKVPCLFMITEVSIRCQKNPGGWYTPYTPQYTTGFWVICTRNAVHPLVYMCDLRKM